MIVAIDGPAGAGKSTIAHRVAEELDFQLIDTGAIYRTVAYRALEDGKDLDSPEEVATLAASLHLDFERNDDGENVLYCDGEPMGNEIRTPHVTRASSQISSIPAVRQALLGIQRELGKRESSVLEGRDIGTVVFPDAEAKIFLTASREVRAHRRLDQMKERGMDGDLDEVLAEIVDRDRRDMERDIAPLKKADDAVEIDTSELEIEDVVQRILEVVEEKK
ncbi:(d)CMP kinase [Persicimonas caeni]|uniref:Cytidylate kinase n=1 Tax=Persicimonas caeni TaxID=2292766 RepID=A0A4Y6Q1C4_PERCE|nr:(d)CMP kinase [Persicimonas caeni]QDG54037.1 (d)CMP kinase [Persicimonas caeni]QED35258.1 (d)CMP kinase [Persicimonas caeni]